MYYEELFKSIERLREELKNKSPQDPQAFGVYIRLLTLYEQIDAEEVRELLKKHSDPKRLG